MDERDIHTPFEQAKQLNEEVESQKLTELLVQALHELYAVQKEQKDQVTLVIVLQVSIVCLLAVLIWFA